MPAHGEGDATSVATRILRHDDVGTTQRSYIKTVPQIAINAMKQLEARIARAAVAGRENPALSTDSGKAIFVFLIAQGANATSCSTGVGPYNGSCQIATLARQ